MRGYLIRRLLLIIPTLWILTIMVFLAVRFLPGDVVDAMVAEMESWSAAGGVIDREALEQMLGLDVPVHVQYGRWMGGILLRGSFGESLTGHWAIEERIIGRLPVTLELGFLAIVIGSSSLCPSASTRPIRQDTAADYVGRTVAVIGIATPNFWLGIMVMLYPAIWWGWSPSVELIPFKEDPLGNLGMFLIPSLILGTAMSAATMRLTRHHDAGGAQAGLHQDCLVQGAQGEGDHYQTRHQERVHPGTYPDRHAAPSSGRRLCHLGGDIRSAGV